MFPGLTNAQQSRIAQQVLEFVYTENTSEVLTRRRSEPGFPERVGSAHLLAHELVVSLAG
jgi:hypothetical protein